MYFDSNQINSKLICKKCEGRLDEPRILPCGKNICLYCLAYIQVGNNSEFQCLICDESHEMPKKGLPINELAIEMLSFQAIQVSRGKAFDSLQETWKDIQTKKDLLKNCLTNSDDYIHEYFVDLRNEIQLATEESIQQLNCLNEKIIEEIDEYEKEIMNLNKTNKSLENSNELSNELELFHLKIGDYLKQHCLNDIEMSRFHQEALSLKEKAELEISNQREIIFKGRFLTFASNKEKFKKSILGELHETKVNKINSLILTTNRQFKELIDLCEFSIEQEWKLIYRASQHGFEAAKFHSKCDHKANTLIIIKSTNGNVFGGYALQDWSGQGWKIDPSSFLFSLINLKKKPIKMNWFQNNQLGCFRSHGPVFGGGNDLRISDKSNLKDTSYSNLGYSYAHPDYAYGSDEAKKFLAGSYYFQVAEIEVYTI